MIKKRWFSSSLLLFLAAIRLAQLEERQSAEPEIWAGLFEAGLR